MKDATLNAGDDQTEQTHVFDIVRGTPWPAIYLGRALRNAFFSDWHGREDELAADQPAQEKACLAAAADDFGTRVVWRESASIWSTTSSQRQRSSNASSRRLSRH